MIKLLIILPTVLLFSSCAIHHGNISTSSLNRNVQYQDIAYGVAQTKTFFGIGGLSQDALVLEAKRELLKNRPLKAKEEYANFTIDFKRSFFPFYSPTKVTLSADVVKFTDDSAVNPITQNYKNKLSTRLLSNSLFEVGDSVQFDKTKIGSVISFSNNSHVIVEYKNKNDKVRTKILSIYRIYSTSKPYKGLRIGDRYIYSLKDDSKTSGKIVGLGIKNLIVKSNKGNIEYIDYTE